MERVSMAPLRVVTVSVSSAIPGPLRCGGWATNVASVTPTRNRVDDELRRWTCGDPQGRVTVMDAESPQLTVADLLRSPGLQLSLVAGSAGLGRRVAWA